MFTSMLQKNDETYTLEVPVEVVESLHLRPGSAVEVKLQDETLVLQPRRRSKYSAEELLAQCDPNAPWPEEDAPWDKMVPVGGELV